MGFISHAIFFGSENGKFYEKQKKNYWKSLPCANILCGECDYCWAHLDLKCKV